MSKPKWNAGPPPNVGWWIASTQRDPEILRWWNGKAWSWPAHESQSPSKAAEQAKRTTGPRATSKIEWLKHPDSWSKARFD